MCRALSQHLGPLGVNEATSKIKDLAILCPGSPSLPKQRKYIIHCYHPVTVFEKDRASRVWKEEGKPSITAGCIQCHDVAAVPN